MSRLTEKQRKWAEAWAGEANGNATEAARLAGYKGSEETLGRMGFDNTRNPKIRAYLRELTQDDPLVASREERLAFFTAIVRGDEPGASIRDRMTAAEHLGKIAGDYGAKGTDDDPVVSKVQLEIVSSAPLPPPGAPAEPSPSRLEE